MKSSNEEKSGREERRRESKREQGSRGVRGRSDVEVEVEVHCGAGTVGSESESEFSSGTRTGEDHGGPKGVGRASRSDVHRRYGRVKRRSRE